MIAAYARVSTKAQDLTMQREAIRRLAKSHRISVLTWYTEKTSGVNERPALSRLRADVRAGKVTACYVYRLDRLSRSGILEVLNIVHEFRDAGCALRSVADGFPLQGPASDIVLAVLAWVAEFERGLIRERVATARREREAKGLPWGRRRRVTEASREGKLLRKLAAEGNTLREISIAAKVPKSTVARFLSQKPPTPRRSPAPTKKGLQPVRT